MSIQKVLRPQYIGAPQSGPFVKKSIDVEAIADGTHIVQDKDKKLNLSAKIRSALEKVDTDGSVQSAIKKAISSIDPNTMRPKIDTRYLGYDAQSKLTLSSTSASALKKIDVAGTVSSEISKAIKKAVDSIDISPVPPSVDGSTITYDMYDALTLSSDVLNILKYIDTDDYVTNVLKEETDKVYEHVTEVIENSINNAIDTVIRPLIASTIEQTPVKTTMEIAKKTTSGTMAWIAPDLEKGNYDVIVELKGGGGAGGYGSTSDSGAGGGEGGFIMFKANVIPGNKYTITVGGGAQSATVNPTKGTPSTAFGATAFGGISGIGTTPGTGGAVAPSSNNYIIQHNGANGFSPTTMSGQGGGLTGGPGATSTIGANGLNGCGGAGGFKSSAGSPKGGKGGDGFIVIKVVV